MNIQIVAVGGLPTSAAWSAHAQQLSAAWRQARQESERAYIHWSESARPQRRLAYAVFLAAVDREAAAERGFRVAIDHA